MKVAASPGLTVFWVGGVVMVSGMLEPAMPGEPQSLLSAAKKAPGTSDVVRAVRSPVLVSLVKLEKLVPVAAKSTDTAGDAPDAAEASQRRIPSPVELSPMLAAV